MPRWPIVRAAAGNVGPNGRLPEDPAVLLCLIAHHYITRHLGNEVFGKPRMVSECFDNLLASLGRELLPGNLGDDTVADRIPGESIRSHQHEGDKEQAGEN